MSKRVYHPRCNKSWPNSDTVGHCAACCETFYGLEAFDKHRRGGVCKTSDAKFWQDDKGWWHHGKRMSEEQREKLRALREK